MEAKKDQTFQEFMEKELLPYYMKLTKGRNTLRHLTLRSYLIYLPLYALYVFGGSYLIIRMDMHIGGDLGTYLFIGPLLVHMLWIVFKFEGHKIQQEEDEIPMFKEQVIKKICHFLNPSYSYMPVGWFNEELFYKSGLFDRYNDFNTIYDVIEGTIGTTKFIFANITTSNFYYYNRMERNEQIALIKSFRGIIFAATFHKNFNGHTIVKTDFSEKKLGYLGRDLQRLINGHKLVELENPDFEKSFKVTSTDQVEARYILSVNFMEKILTLKEKLASEIQLSFIDNKVFITIAGDIDLFKYEETSNPEAWKSQIAMFVYQFKMISFLIQELNLNNQLWNYHDVG